jgi:hypothetical protein
VVLHLRILSPSLRTLAGIVGQFTVFRDSSVDYYRFTSGRSAPILCDIVDGEFGRNYAMITVVLADDHAVVTKGLEALLRRKFTLLRTVQDGLVAEVL